VTVSAQRLTVTLHWVSFSVKCKAMITETLISITIQGCVSKVRRPIGVLICTGIYAKSGGALTSYWVKHRVSFQSLREMPLALHSVVSGSSSRT